MLVDHTQVHEKVRTQLLKFEVGTLYCELRALAHGCEQGVHKTAIAKNCGRDKFISKLSQRHQARTRALMQALDERQHFVAQHARHQPFATFHVHLVQGVDGHGDGDAIFGVTRLVQVDRRAVDATQSQHAREGGRGDACGFVAHELVT